MAIFPAQFAEVFRVAVDIVAEVNEEVRLVLHHEVEHGLGVFLVAAGAEGNFRNQRGGFLCGKQ